MITYHKQEQKKSIIWAHIQDEIYIHSVGNPNIGILA